MRPDPLRDNDLDASLQDFDHPLSSPLSPRPCSTLPSEPTTDNDPFEDEDDEEAEDSEIDSGAGGYSPPAWRRLGNGDRSSGFWKGPHDDLLAAMPPPRVSTRDSSPELEDSDTESVLKKAIRTRLPPGSMSPDKRRSPSPNAPEDRTLRLDDVNTLLPPLLLPKQEVTIENNYIRFAVHAEVQHHAEPITALVKFLTKHYRSATSTWLSALITLVISLVSISLFRGLLGPTANRPTGDLVKVAGLAKSFEPLIYYSENAVLQVHDLQATSVAVWDLSESVRSSDMRDAVSIVSDLDSLSETMKTLSLEMTKFFSRVDGDIDGILNVMDWAKMHLRRLQSSHPPSTLSSAYDNIHNMLSSARILEDSTGVPTPIGSMTTYIFGVSNSQREQRLIQLLFTEFLTVLEDSIQAELQHSITLVALFEVVDRHFLNLARTVIRETTAQEEMQDDMLSNLWTRILGPRAEQLRKYEQNRKLLHNVRDKTVQNKHNLLVHQSKLLTLKDSLESLRGKLVSPLVRSVNATILTLDDQIHGLSSVSDYLSELRTRQKGKVMESLFASLPSKKLLLDEARGTTIHGNS